VAFNNCRLAQKIWGIQSSPQTRPNENGIPDLLRQVVTERTLKIRNQGRYGIFQSKINER
jgi:hypothetical protein